MSGGLIASAVVAVAILLVLPPVVSATGINGGDGTNYIAYYSFDRTGSTTSHSWVSPIPRQIGPDSINIISTTATFHGGTWMMYVISETDNGTPGTYVGFQYNTSTVDVIIWDSVQPIPGTTEYLSLSWVWYIISPSDTHQHGVGNVLDGTINGSLSTHISAAASAYQTISRADSGGANATIRAWGAEESLISTAMSAFAGALPSAIGNLQVPGSWFITQSVKDTNQTYSAPSSSSAPGNSTASNTSTVSSSSTVSNASLLVHRSGGAPGCRPDYPIGHNSWDDAKEVIYCILLIVAVVGAGALGAAWAASCVITLGLTCILGVVVGLLAGAVLYETIEKCTHIRMDAGPGNA